MTSLLEPTTLFEQTMQWLRDQYATFHFYTERDLVWTVQRHITDEIERHKLPYLVFNDYPMLPGAQRSRSADLVLASEAINRPKQSQTGKWGISPAVAVAVAVEFKYEPSHARIDIWPTKLPVVGWSGILKDIARLHEFIEHQRADAAYAVFFDESRTFRHRALQLPESWQDWGQNVAVHWTKVTPSCIPTDQTATPSS
ncbi:MAG: hypothetical protein ABI068_18120 [Ktedonobacterales bacterium]